MKYPPKPIEFQELNIVTALLDISVTATRSEWHIQNFNESVMSQFYHVSCGQVVQCGAVCHKPGGTCQYSLPCPQSCHIKSNGWYTVMTGKIPGHRASLPFVWYQIIPQPQAACFNYLPEVEHWQELNQEPFLRLQVQCHRYATMPQIPTWWLNN